MKFYKYKNMILFKIFECENSNDKACEIIPNISGGTYEKHIPVVKIDNNVVKVKVGEIDHPMIDAHYIVMIAIETSEGYYIKKLKPGNEPYAEFILKQSEVFIKAYEYCNIHSLWSN